MRNRLVSTGLLAAACAGAWVAGSAQGVRAGDLAGRRPMTFADLQRMKRVSDPQISPSGKWVMFSVTEVDLEKNSRVNHLWVVPLADGSGREADSSASLRNDKQREMGGEDERREADSSAALRNDKQSALRNDKQSALRNDKQSALRNDKQSALRNDKQKSKAERQVTFWKEG